MIVTCYIFVLFNLGWNLKWVFVITCCPSVSMSHFSSCPPFLNKGINYFVCSNEGPHMHPFPMGFKSNVNEYTLTTCKPIGHKASFCWRGFMIFYIWERSLFSQKGNMYSFIYFSFNQCASIIIALHKVFLRWTMWPTGLLFLSKYCWSIFLILSITIDLLLFRGVWKIFLSDKGSSKNDARTLSKMRTCRYLWKNGIDSCMFFLWIMYLQRYTMNHYVKKSFL